MINKEDVYKIGYIAKTHGLAGEVILAGDCQEREYFILETEGILVPFFVKSYRPRRADSALVIFDGIDSVERAKEFVGCDVFAERSTVNGENSTSPEDEDELPLSYFVGFMIMEDDREIGRIDYVDDSTENCLFVTEDGKMIPVQDEFIEEIDHEGRKLFVSLPEGLLDL